MFRYVVIIGLVISGIYYIKDTITEHKINLLFVILSFGICIFLAFPELATFIEQPELLTLFLTSMYGLGLGMIFGVILRVVLFCVVKKHKAKN